MDERELEKKLREMMNFGWQDLATLGRHKWLEFAMMAAKMGAELERKQAAHCCSCNKELICPCNG